MAISSWAYYLHFQLFGVVSFTLRLLPLAFWDRRIDFCLVSASVEFAALLQTFWIR
jgi:hypothetical protein